MAVKKIPAFSILLPTRNRLEYLRLAVETVRRQDHADWEMVISDNASDQPVGEYVASLDDPRVRYSRSETTLPVTENWSRALGMSRGQYVLMLGDDDGLLPGYLSTMANLIHRFEEPDCIYSGAYLFAYPGVIPSMPAGFLQPYGYAEFLRSKDEPYLLDRETAFEMVRDSMRFRLRFGYNMQFSLISRAFIDRIADRGPFFQSPFPDYYAMNVTFLMARSIVACPAPLLVIGITGKSYGFFHFNRQEQSGIEFLGGGAEAPEDPDLQEVLLPGTYINTGWLLAMETIRRNFKDMPLRVDRSRYRRLQIIHVYQEHYIGSRFSREEFRDFAKRLNRWESLLFGPPLAALLRIVRLPPRRWRWRVVDAATRFLRGVAGQLPEWSPPTIVGRYDDLLAVFNDLNGGTTD